MSINETVREYLRIKPELDALKKRVDAMTATIKSALDGADSIDTGEYIVTAKRTPSIRLDTAALYADFPDIKETYGRESVSVSIAAIVEKAAAKSA